jgi:lipoprotein-anchoring transpeptidase ErfK/SrfK
MDRRSVVRFLWGSAALLVHPNPSVARSLFADELVIHNRSKTLIALRFGRPITQFPIAIGRVAMQWTGSTQIVRKVVYPSWQPPSIVRRDRPTLPDIVPPGPNNPLGTRALELARPEYAIHGTNDPASIGRAVSYGCFRMHNRDIEWVYDTVGVGTPVRVI